MSMNPDPLFSGEQEIDDLMLTALRLWSTGPRAEKRSLSPADQAELHSAGKRTNTNLVDLIVSGAFLSTAMSEIVVSGDPIAPDQSLFTAMHRSAPDTAVTKTEKDEMEKLVERDRKMRQEKGKSDGR